MSVTTNHAWSLKYCGFNDISVSLTKAGFYASVTEFILENKTICHILFNVSLVFFVICCKIQTTFWSVCYFEFSLFVIFVQSPLTYIYIYTLSEIMWASSLPMREDVTYVMSSFISWDLHHKIWDYKSQKIFLLHLNIFNLTWCKADREILCNFD